MRYFVVDAFADKLFQGNPAGVCVADGPLSEGLMQRIASENESFRDGLFGAPG